MHIPDGYLSPATCGTLGAAMVPVWATAGRRVRKVVRSRYVPLVAIGAAYSFLVMMFNVPIPDGTTAHAVGGVLVACLLGPWAAVVAVSIALLIQALFFGDGGVLAFGANAFNMAFVMPMIGYGVYRLLSHRVSLTSPRRAFAAGLGGYVGLNAAALCAAVEFGLQPTLFHRADGTPLYAPFHLAQTIPAMALAHLTVAGAVELVLSAGVMAYLQRANLPLLRINHGDVADTDAHLPEPRRLGRRWGLVGVAVTAVLTPLGLLAPGGAFGEDAPANLDLKRYHLGTVPDGLARYAGFWHHAIFRGYDFRNDAHPALGYLVSAFVGVAVIAAAVFAVYGLARVTSRAHAHAHAPHPRDLEGRDFEGRGLEGLGATRSSTPEWLKRPEVGLCPCGCIGRRRKGSFVEKTIGGAAGLLRDAMFSEEVASRPGFLQRVDVRVKLAVLLGLLVVAGVVRGLPSLVAMYALGLVLARASCVSLKFFVKRVWLFIPIFTGIVVLPATLNVVTPGHVVVGLGSWFGIHLGLTAQGLTAAALIVARVATSISFAVLVTVTTPWPQVLAALRSLFVPRVFVLVLGMAYRYLFHMLNAVTEMYTARKARSAGTDRGVRSSRAFVAASAGALFGKAHALSEEVHLAMVARGYTGDARTFATARIRVFDVAFAVAGVATAFAVIGGDRVLAH